MDDRHRTAPRRDGRLHLRWPVDDLEALRAAARAERETVTEYVRRAVRRALREREARRA